MPPNSCPSFAIRRTSDQLEVFIVWTLQTPVPTSAQAAYRKSKDNIALCSKSLTNEHVGRASSALEDIRGW